MAIQELKAWVATATTEKAEPICNVIYSTDAPGKETLEDTYTLFPHLTEKERKALAKHDMAENVEVSGPFDLPVGQTVILLEGAPIINEVISNIPNEVIIIDSDIEGVDSDSDGQLFDIEGQKQYVSYFDANTDHDRLEHLRKILQGDPIDTGDESEEPIEPEETEE